jgi:hypothetical protein
MEPYKNHVYETKYKMVADLIGCIFSASSQFRNDTAMLHRAASSLLNRVLVLLREGSGYFEQYSHEF